MVTADEGTRPGTTLTALAALRPAFGRDGTITAGNASQISDGAAAVVVTSPRAAQRLGAVPLAEIVGYGRAAGPGPSLLVQPSRAIFHALRQCHLELGDMDVIEVNEAFAAVVVASAADLNLPVEMFNPNGGAIALGHPIGMSGCRLPLTLALELRRRGGGTGVAALCGGGGLGDALVLKVAS
jgi:acetyl-CoA C-acetyltransferase